MIRLVVSTYFACFLFLNTPAQAQFVIADFPSDIARKMRNSNPDLDFLGLSKDGSMTQIRLPRALWEQSSDIRQSAVLIDKKASPSLNLEGYLDHFGVLDALWELERRYPNLVTSFQVALSTQGRSIRGIVISADNNVKNKPAILFNGMHHAREVMTTEVVMDIADHLLKNYSTDSEIKSWIDNYQIVLVPQVNPDGNNIVHNSDNFWRKNAWLNSSGKIVGVDLNRNYPTLWNGCGGSSSSQNAQNYRGPKAASESETTGMMGVVAKFKPIFNISYHSYSELILYPFGCKKAHNDSNALFKEIAEQMNAAIIDDQGHKGTYRVGTAPELLYEADGTDLDYQWAEHGVIAYTIELNAQTQGFQPDYKRWRQRTVENQRQGWKTLLRRMDTHAVRGLIPANEKILSMKIMVKHDGHWLTWDSNHTGAVHIRSDGLFFQVLQRGHYQLRIISEDSTKIRVHEFKIGSKNVDLGML